MRNLLVLTSFLWFFISCNNDNKVIIHFAVSSQKSLEEKEAIYLTGNLKQLGMWKADQVKLKKEKDHWISSLAFKKGDHIELKFTKGSWENEAVDAAGKVLPNFYFDVKSDTTLTFKIDNWKDQLHQPFKGQITGKTIVKNFDPLGIKARDVIVWLPPNYEENPDLKYPVLYMHDGQNIIDPSTSYMGTDWQIDEVADSLIRNGIIEPIIIVGVNNTTDRAQELSYGDIGDHYQYFLIKQLKPYIDSNYRTKRDKENTAIMGSSMGGLSSFVMAWENNQIFSKAACLSPAFRYKNEFDYVSIAQKYEGGPKKIEFYIDNGTLGVDHQLQPGIDAMMEVLSAKKQDFVYFLDEGAEHNEPAWAKRIHRPLIQFFGIKE